MPARKIRPPDELESVAKANVEANDAALRAVTQKLPKQADQLAASLPQAAFGRPPRRPRESKPCPAKKPRPPSYRLHKPSGQAVVTIAGRDVYLGQHGSRESRTRYDQAVGQWMAAGRPRTRTPANPEPLIVDVLLAYAKHVKDYHRCRISGETTTEGKHILRIIDRVQQLCPEEMLAQDFGPVLLEQVQQAYIDAGDCRRFINNNVRRIVGIFKWAVAKELIPSSVWERLRAVPGLRYGHTDARETDPVRPVADAHVEAVLPFVLPEIAAMIQIQRLTGMRSGELVIARSRDIDTTGRIWTYVPARHKTQHHGHTREVYIGPRAQKILRPWLRLNVDEYLWSPRRAISAEFSKCPTHRRQPVEKKKTQRALADHYDPTAYYRAVQRGCDAAELAARGFRPPFKCDCPGCGATFKKWHGLTVHAQKKHGQALQRPKIEGDRLIPRWWPHQLRHNAATEVRRELGLEAAKAVLGQKTLTATLIYAEADQARARNAAAKLG